MSPDIQRTIERAQRGRLLFVAAFVVLATAWVALYLRVEDNRAHIIRVERIVLPNEQEKRQHRKGVVHQTPSHAGQQPGPSKGGHQGKGGKGHSGGKTHTKPPRSTKTPVPPPTEQLAPSPAPGNSDETPSAAHSKGVQTCVELAVSACVDADLP